MHKRPLYDYTICVYGGASQRAPLHHQQLSADVGRMIAEQGGDLVFGGGAIGLMGASSKAAQAAGSRVTGVTTKFLVDMEAANHDLDELIIVDTMHERKNIMMQRGQAFVILPGGFGTLEEVMEVMTLKQLGQLDKPIVFADFQGYWRPLLEAFDHFEHQGYLHHRTKDLYSLAETPQQVLSQLTHALASPGQDL